MVPFVTRRFTPKEAAFTVCQIGMIIDWSKLLPALLFLLLPIGLFHGKKTRFRAIERDWDQHWPQILTLGLHWIDLVRAFAGAWWLVDGLSAAPGVRGLMSYAPALAEGGVLILSVMLQTFVCKERDSAHAPFLFVTGLVLGAFSPTAAGFAIVLAAVAATGTRTPVAYFPILALALAGLGYAFEGRKAVPLLAPGAVAVIVPWLLPLMFHRDLLVTYRARRTSSPGGSATEQP